MMDVRRFIETMPKAELHLHIEGTLEPDMMMALAARNGIQLPYPTVDAIRAAYDFGNLQDFLDLYYAGMSVLQTRQDFFDLAFAYLTHAHAQNVVHAEIFFDPQGHTGRGISFDTVLSGLTDALDKARRDYGIEAKLIMCFLRHLPEDSAFDTLRQACRCKDHIIAVGLDSTELGHPPAKFARVFAEARKQGFIAVAHAGEEGPAQYIADALDLLGVERIDHGNRVLDDPALVARVARQQTPMTLCPLSNKRLNVCADLKRYPLRRMMEAGLLVTINSDDPAYFGGYVSENYLAVYEALDLSLEEITTLGRNSFAASFLSQKDKAAALEKFDQACRR